MDPPNITISEGGGKQHNTSSSPLIIGVNQPNVDQPNAEAKDAAEDGPGTMDEFPALANWGNVNKNETTDEMD